MNKYQELHETGSVRLYESEGYDLKALCHTFDIMLDPEIYCFSIIEGTKENFLEIIKF